VGALAALLAGAGAIRAQYCPGEQAQVDKMQQQISKDQASITALACNKTSPPACLQQQSALSSEISQLGQQIINAHQQYVDKRCPVVPNPPPAPGLAVTDVSPDSPFATLISQNLNTAGRVYTLALDSTNQVLYAVADGGVWKSTDAGKTWQRSSVGIRNVYNHNTKTLQKVAVDGNNPRRLLLITSAFDGRTSQQPYGGGLYVSTDAAGHWHHVQLCPDQTTDLAAVVFVSGQPFVSAPCGIFSNSDAQLADAKWTQLSKAPVPGGSHIAGAGNTLFSCSGTQVYRYTIPSKTWSKPVDLGSSTSCWVLSAVPAAAKGSEPDTVAVLIPNTQAASAKAHPYDVTLVNFTSGKTASLGFSSVSAPNGSGVASVFAVRRAKAAANDSQPGIAFDIYAADAWAFFFYSVKNGTVTWKRLVGDKVRDNGKPDDNEDNYARPHVDSWSMAFPSNYDPSYGICTAYMSNDGGVFKNNTPLPPPSSTHPLPCDPSQGWVTAMHGLHALGGGVLAGFSQTQGLPGSILYMPTADNDVWAVPLPNGGGQAGPLGDGAGDAGGVELDPAYRTQVVGTRNLREAVVVGQSGPPGPTSAATFTPGYPAGTPFPVPPCGVADGNPPGPCHSVFGALSGAFLTQVKALKGESLVTPQYFAIEGQAIPNNQPDAIVMSTANPPTPTSWIEPGNAQNRFPHGTIVSLTSSGGVRNPLLWVVTTDGKIHKGQFDIRTGHLSQWSPASDSNLGNNGNGEILFVNPYDPNSNYAWITDVANQAIFRTINGGKSWQSDPVLTAISTNYGEFRFGSCVGGAVQWTPCALVMMSFSRRDPGIAVATLYPGGVAYTQDYGEHWAVLDGVAKSGNGTVPPAQQDLPSFTYGAWYDDNQVTGTPVIYVSRVWNGIVRLEGNFGLLPSVWDPSAKTTSNPAGQAAPGGRAPQTPSRGTPPAPPAPAPPPGRAVPQNAAPGAVQPPPAALGCLQGFVWREAYPNDYACVTPAARTQAAQDNRLAASRRNPNAPPGNDGCLRGFVWREANPADHVCVTPETRAQTVQDNRMAASRTAAR